MQRIYFSEADKWLNDNGFLLGFEQFTDRHGEEDKKFNIYIHPTNYVVISVEESFSDHINQCQIFCNWQLKPAYYDEKIELNDYSISFGGVIPNYYNAGSNKKDPSKIQESSLSTSDFGEIIKLYQLFSEKATFLCWKEKPFIYLKTHEEQYIVNLKSHCDDKLKYAITSLNLNLSDFALST